MDYLSSRRLKLENELLIIERIEKDFHGFPNPTITDGDSQLLNRKGFDIATSESEETFKLNEISLKNKSLFNCIKCQSVFKVRDEFDRHLKLHDQYWCNICDIRYKTALALNRHSLCHTHKYKTLPSVTSKKTFKCPTCAMEFKSENIYSLHLTMHSNPLYRCLICERGFTEKRFLTAHLLIHTEKKNHECPTCKKRFRRLADVRHHSASHSDAKPYSCNQCDKSYKIKGELTKHMDKKHETKLICTQCDAVFKTRGALRTHTKNHTFKCDSCDKVFKTPSVLKRHSIVHSEKRVYRCALCNQTYKTGLTLSQHLLSHSDARSYKCSVCDKKFNRRTTCNEHMLLHLDKSLLPDKNKCPHCGKAFYTQKDVRKHVQSHESNRYFVCDICNKTFRKTYTLEEHMRKSHGYITEED